MATNHYEERLDKELSNVETANISATDKEVITEFIESNRGDLQPTTLTTRIKGLRLFSARADMPIVEMTTADVSALLGEFADGSHPDVKDEGLVIRPYQITLRAFYRHIESDVDPEQIDVDTSEKRQLTPEDIWLQDDVDELFSACHNLRDRAFFAVGLATGQRLDALRTLRLKHIDEEGPTMDVILNTQEGQTKGAQGSKPLLWAKHYLKPWYDNHPYKDDPDAALFCVLPDGGGSGNKSDDEKKEPMTPATFRQLSSRYFSAAGIDKPSNPHMMRHTAITRMVIEGLSEQQIKGIVGWDPDSSQFSTYAQVADQMNNDSVRESLGLPTSGIERVVGKPSVIRCPECGDEHPEQADYCDNCNVSLTHRGDIEDDAPPRTVNEIEDTDDARQMMEQLEERLAELD